MKIVSKPTQTLRQGKRTKLLASQSELLKATVVQISTVKTLSWWTPVWRGLVVDKDSKHRKTIGSAIWLYLYLLMYAKRQTGLVWRSQKEMAQETGYSLRAVQLQLKRLQTQGYIEKEQVGRQFKIKITKWKSCRKIKPSYE